MCQTSGPQHANGSMPRSFVQSTFQSSWKQHAQRATGTASTCMVCAPAFKISQNCLMATQWARKQSTSRRTAQSRFNSPSVYLLAPPAHLQHDKSIRLAAAQDPVIYASCSPTHSFALSVLRHTRMMLASARRPTISATPKVRLPLVSKSQPVMLMTRTLRSGRLYISAVFATYSCPNQSKWHS